MQFKYANDRIKFLPDTDVDVFHLGKLTQIIDIEPIYIKWTWGNGIGTLEYVSVDVEILLQKVLGDGFLWV